MRNSFVFYRSFFESIVELEPIHQAEIFRAIADYSLNQVEPNFTGICKTVWILIKPQLEANYRKYESGTKPKRKQTETKAEANDKQKVSKRQAKHKQEESKDEANVNDNVNDNVNVEKHKLIIWLEENCPKIQKMTKPITNEQAEKLKSEFDHNILIEVFQSMENNKDLLKKYDSANLTVRNWIKMRKDKEPKATQYNPYLLN